LWPKLLQKIVLMPGFLRGTVLINPVTGPMIRNCLGTLLVALIATSSAQDTNRNAPANCPCHSEFLVRDREKCHSELLVQDV
jgi:hypothetical protein